MSEQEVRKYPKCGGHMERRGLWSYGGIFLVENGGFLGRIPLGGEKIIPFCCESCGYIELYRRNEE